MTNQRDIDSPSQLGQFGWEKIGSGDFSVPVILRSNEIRYCPVRIVEQEIIKKYDALPPTVFQCITLKSFYLTATEAKLLNSINFQHCNNKYGNQFFTIKDVIISAADVKELSRFLNISHTVFNQDLSQLSSKLGLIRFRPDPHDSNGIMLVPYICKVYTDQPTRFIPWKLIEPSVVISNSTTVKASPNDWDIMYFKMLCIFCKNGAENYITRDYPIVLLEGLKYSKINSSIIYDDYKTTQNYQK